MALVTISSGNRCGRSGCPTASVKLVPDRPFRSFTRTTNDADKGPAGVPMIWPFEVNENPVGSEPLASANV